MKNLHLLLFLFCISILQAQEYFPAHTGVKTTKNSLVAITNATIYVTPTKVIKKGTLLVKNGKIVNVGKSVSIPNEAKVLDLTGKTIYPSFIDVYSSFGIKKAQRTRSNRSNPQYDASRKGYYWNDHILSDQKAASSFQFDSKKAGELIKAGFGVVNTHIPDGIMRGTGMLVSLDTHSSDAYRILDDSSANYLSFDKSVKSRQSYPTSLMGSMALLRQVYLDADWYANVNTKNIDKALEAVNTNKNEPQIFYTNSAINVLRADKVGDESNIQYTIVGSGHEYEKIEDIKSTGATMIIPINFRKAYDVADPFLAEKVSLQDMRRWNQEPSNLSVLTKNDVNFALTTHSLKSVKSFHKNLQKALTYGVNHTKALEALTIIPASILGKSDIGNLNKGSYANFLVTDGDIFDSKTTLYENWVLGNKNIINKRDVPNLNGSYSFTFQGKNYSLSVSGKGSKQKGNVTLGDKKVKSTFAIKNNWISLNMNDAGNISRIVAQPTSNGLSGTLFASNGNELTWSAVKNTEVKKSKKIKKKSENKTSPKVLPVSFPNIGLGNASLPKQQTLLIKNATVWTSENNAVLENTDVLIKGGKISKIGINLSSGNAKVIDGTGKFLTAGIIDEHTHIAAAAVNEAGHNSSAEVSIEDVVNPDDINIYRNIAGGVTSAQILHGSANPIGGRSALIKLKWGESAENLIYKNSPKFIKFALGENIKQSNWGDGAKIRFPQTRMGAEQVFIDYFQRAKEYNTLKNSGKPFRKDIELEVLSEIINKERFISCHSYVQSEINMLMKVAEKFDFNINTFTHILEGYKVAEKMKKHGVGGSTFSDWWAYKYEVNDAIPHNAAIMHEAGVTVAINSDDREMSRRLNQEAAKTIKYGGVSEMEAWNMVTINPAKLLHLDDRTGSIKVGKDADVVLWSGNPLSIYSKAEKTIIDGAIYFDIEEDAKKRTLIKQERSKLIDMMMQEKLKGAPTQAPSKKVLKEFHCDTE